MNSHKEKSITVEFIKQTTQRNGQMSYHVASNLLISPATKPVFSETPAVQENIQTNKANLSNSSSSGINNHEVNTQNSQSIDNVAHKVTPIKSKKPPVRLDEEDMRTYVDIDLDDNNKHQLMLDYNKKRNELRNRMNQEFLDLKNQSQFKAPIILNIQADQLLIKTINKSQSKLDFCASRKRKSSLCSEVNS